MVGQTTGFGGRIIPALRYREAAAAIDIEGLRKKYAHERDKRLRPEGSTQYLELAGDFAEFAEVDPHSPVTPRTPINEDIEVAVLGGGIAGLLADTT